MAGIYLIEKDGNLVELRERPYDSEDYLQDLLARYPNLLAGDQIDTVEPRRWLLIGREMGVQSADDGSIRWSADHLFVDQDGVPTIVEVKRSTDTRIRREVVGQMLDYAANGIKYWPVETLQSRFEARCVNQSPPQDPTKVLADILRSAEGDVDPINAFWFKVKTNLQAGRIRMLFIADEIPLELARIVEFLNAQMDPAEVLAVEVRQFANDTVKTLVPRVIGQTAEAQIKKAAGVTHRQWDEASFFLELEQRRGKREASVCRDIFDWAKNHRDLKIWWGKGGKDGSFSVRLQREGETYYLLSAWTYGRVEIQFEMLSKEPPFDNEWKRIELLRRLNQIPGVSLERDVIGRRPTISLATLVQDDAVAKLFEALEWVTEEAKTVQSLSASSE